MRQMPQAIQDIFLHINELQNLPWSREREGPKSQIWEGFSFKGEFSSLFVFVISYALFLFVISYALQQFFWLARYKVLKVERLKIGIVFKLPSLKFGVGYYPHS